jgi:hypothetical protein
MPVAVAEYWLKRTREHEARHSGWCRYELPGTTSPAEVLTASPQELMARYFASSQRPGDELEPIRWKILGTVMDGQEAAIVVYKPEGGRRRDPLMEASAGDIFDLTYVRFPEIGSLLDLLYLDPSKLPPPEVIIAPSQQVGAIAV